MSPELGCGSGGYTPGSFDLGPYGWATGIGDAQTQELWLEERERRRREEDEIARCGNTVSGGWMNEKCEPVDENTGCVIGDQECYDKVFKQPIETPEERSARLAEEGRQRRERNARCAQLRVDAALKGLGFGAGGSAVGGGIDAYRRYGTWRAVYLGAGRAVTSVGGLIATGLSVSYDVLTATNGDASCQ